MSLPQTSWSRGALCVLAEHELPDFTGCYIQVESTLAAVREIAEFYRKGLDIKVVGITGSVGKTSTKEMIASVLSEKYKVLKTLGNFNNELGLPLTVFRLTEEDEVAVLEMGISNFGEMHRLRQDRKTGYLCDDQYRVNAIWKRFMTGMESFRQNPRFSDFLKEDGGIVLNGDDDKLSAIQEIKGIKPVFFGLESGRSIYADEIAPKGLKGISCRIHTPKGEFEVMIPIPGVHMVRNALAATAVGLLMGLSLEEIKSGIEKSESLSGRFHIIEKGSLTIIDDCYNASPVAMKASLDILKDAEGRKVAVLGDMFELGEDAAALHASVGAHAAGNAIDLLICVGKTADIWRKPPLRREDAGKCSRFPPWIPFWRLCRS